jgi:hypothetical protein
MAENLPIGSIILWENDAIPAGWQECDGTNGTPNMADKFVRGAAEDADIATSGGADTHTHSNPNTSTRADHNHGGSASASVSGGSSTTGTACSGTGCTRTDASAGHTHSASFTPSGAGAHSHSVGDTGSASTIPVYIKRVFIMRVS